MTHPHPISKWSMAPIFQTISHRIPEGNSLYFAFSFSEGVTYQNTAKGAGTESSDRQTRDILCFVSPHTHTLTVQHSMLWPLLRKLICRICNACSLWTILQVHTLICGYTQMVHCRIHNGPTLNNILNQINRVITHIFHFLKICF
jgi:hypothetical protein